MQITERCPVCSSARVEASWQVPDHEYRIPHLAVYVLCGDCASFYQRPMPTAQELAGFYPATYHSFGAQNALSRIKNRTRLRRLTSFLTTSAPVVLDYGCGDGAFIRQAATISPDARFWGYEIDASRSTTVLADGRVTIVRGTLDDLLNVLPRCDLVTMNHVIEHLPDPLAVIVALRARLKDAGVIEGQTPAADSLERRIFGRAWSGFHAPRHTVVFSRRGLDTLLHRAGLADIAITAGFNPAGIAVSLASLAHGKKAGVVARTGASWLMCLAAATILHPMDRVSGAPGIIDFAARMPARTTTVPSRTG